MENNKYQLLNVNQYNNQENISEIIIKKKIWDQKFPYLLIKIK